MMKTLPGTALLLLALSLLLFGPGLQSGHACVGKTLVIGATENPQQQVLAQLLAVLISERTGTSIKVVNFAGNREMHQALLKADLDMYVEYTGVGQVQILKQPAIADPAKLFKAVKQTYNEELNLIWLKPFGFSDERLAPPGTVAEAAPVVRKDTLKKFPALARLINKLGGRVDDQTIAGLEKDASGAPPKQVARRFLKQKRLI